jgi:cold-inducible RNA-binding protein
MTHRIYVGNLPYATNETDLRQLFAAAGLVRSVEIARHHETNYPRGFGFVEMASHADALAAIHQFNLVAFGGKLLEVVTAPGSGRATLPAPSVPRLRGR